MSSFGIDGRELATESEGSGRHGLETWANCKGYLEKRIGAMAVYTSQYFVLEEGKLKAYGDSDRRQLLKERPILPSTAAEVLEPENGRKFRFSVSDTSKGNQFKWVMAAANAEILEMWMISIIQCSRGSFATEERFSMDAASSTTYARQNLDLNPNPSSSYQQLAYAGTNSSSAIQAVVAEAEANPKDKFYVNDPTFVGRILKTNIANPNVHDKVNNLYMQYFAFPCEFPGFILIRVCENQRYLPIKEWNCLHLLPNDPAKLSSNQGEKFPYRYLKTTDPPLGYHWPERPPKGNPGWCVEEECHEQGWRYGANFSVFDSAGADGYLEFSRFSKSSKKSYVRRRIWQRYAQLSAELVTEAAPPTISQVDGISVLDANSFVTTTVDIDTDEVDIASCVISEPVRDQFGTSEVTAVTAAVVGSQPVSPPDVDEDI